jgi:hypothetical protein
MALASGTYLTTRRMGIQARTQNVTAVTGERFLLPIEITNIGNTPVEELRIGIERVQTEGLPGSSITTSLELWSWGWSASRPLILGLGAPFRKRDRMEPGESRTYGPEFYLNPQSRAYPQNDAVFNIGADISAEYDTTSSLLSYLVLTGSMAGAALLMVRLRIRVRRTNR